MVKLSITRRQIKAGALACFLLLRESYCETQKNSVVEIVDAAPSLDQNSAAAAAENDEHIPLGFSLSEIYRVESPKKVRRHLQIAPEVSEVGNVVRPTGGLAAASARDRVRAFAAMNRAIYPSTDFSKHLSKLQPVYEAGQQLLISKSSGENAEERAALETQLASAWADAAVSSLESGGWENQFSPTQGAATGLGVAMAVYTDA